MRIFQVIFDLSGGGAERLVVNLSNELSKKNDVFILLIKKYYGDNAFYKNLVSDRVKVISLNYKSGINFFAFFEIIYLIFKYKPAVVHTHLNTVLYSFLPSVFFKKVDFFHTVHNIADKSVGFKFQKKINKFFFKNYILPIAISPLCARSFKEFYQFDKINVIENAVPTAIHSKRFDEVCEQIKDLKVNTKSKVFINIGRIAPAKNHDLLVSTFNQLIDDGNNIILIILGKTNNLEYLQKLKFKSHSQIHFIGEKDNPIDYLMCSDCFILSSSWEGLPMTILEAMSVGLPVVSTPVGGIPDVVCESYLGVLSSDVTLVSFKDAIQLFLKNYKHFDKDLIIKNFKEKYHTDKLCQSHIDIYTNTS